MKHLIVGADLALGAGLTTALTKDYVNELTAGAITITRSDDNTAAKYDATELVFTSAFADDATIQIAQGTADGVAQLTPPINPRTLKWYKTEYRAPVAKVVHVGRSNSGTPATWTLPDPQYHVGEYAQIRIYDLSAPAGVTNNVAVASYLVKQGDTAGDVHDGLFAELEKYKGKFYANVAKTVATTNLGYAFTGIVGKNFTVIPELLIAGSGVTVQTNFKFGDGIGASLLELEKLFASRKGYNATYWLQNELYTMPFGISSTGTYDVFVLAWTNPNNHVIAAGDDPMVQTVIVALPTGKDISRQFGLALTALTDVTDVWTAPSAT